MSQFVALADQQYWMVLPDWSTKVMSVLPLTLVRWGGGAAGRSALRHDVLATVAGAGAYLTARAVLSYALQLPTSTAGIGAGVLLVSHLYQLVLCLWAPFEGAWLLIGVGAALLLREAWSGRRIAAAGFLYWAAYVAACFLVLDSTRSMSYALVGVFPLLKAMTLRLEPARVRALLALAALVSLLVPNLFVWHDLSYEIGFLSRLYPGT